MSSPAARVPPQILSFGGPDQVLRDSEITLTWKLAGGAPKQIAVDGKPVSGSSLKVKAVSDPTCFTLTVSNDSGTATMKKWVGTHAEGECVSSSLELVLSEGGRLTNNGHAYRIDSLRPEEIEGVTKNLATLDSALCQISGRRSGFDPANLARRLNAIRTDHAPMDRLKLINAELDRERASTVSPHLEFFAYGGRIAQNHAYRIAALSEQEIARVKKNLADLRANVSVIPGFEKVRSVLEERLGKAKTLAQYNASFAAEHEALLQIHPPQDQEADAAHPYRASSTDRGEFARVQENLKKLSAGLHKITNLGDSHQPQDLEEKLQQVELETPKPGHALEMINHHFDQARAAIVGRHAAHIHHGWGSGAQAAVENHPFRIARVDPAEIERVSRNLENLAARLANVPGFGGRFDADAHRARLAQVQPASTPERTLARYNAEFDWERHNLLQVNVQPRPRPQQGPKEEPAGPSRLRLRMMNFDQPMANAKFRIHFGKLVESGTTDADGWLTHAIPKGAGGKADIVFDDGSEFEVLLDHRDDADEISGVQERLHVLGLYFGPIDDQLSPLTRDAIARYQRLHSLPDTGEPDAKTIAALRQHAGD
jgi:hypothetical protein